MVLALSAGVAIRTVRLASVPPGLHQDEACNGYDAYSILTTGRDQHGNFLPISIEAFEDYRPPLFDYSLVPLVGALGLEPAVVRLCAALWGSIDLIALTALAGLLMGLPGALAASILGALSPWHFPYCRFGVAYITASTFVTMGVLSFFLWLRSRRDGWILLSGALFGLSFYTSEIIKFVTPFLVLWLGLLYWRELKQARTKAMIGVALIVVLVLPQAASLWANSAVRRQYTFTSIFHYMSVHNRNDSFVSRCEYLGTAWLSYFTPSYLFLRGDSGSHDVVVAPPGRGELLPEQALLIGLFFLAPLSARRRKPFLLLMGWILLAAVPAVLSVPPGIRGVGAHGERWDAGTPIPTIMIQDRGSDPPLTPGLLLEHPAARRDLLAAVPWTLASAMGLVAMLDLVPAGIGFGAAAAGLILTGAVVHGALNVHSYFRDYPAIAAPYFKYGVEQVIAQIDKSGHDPVAPVIITRKINQPYIFVLFFEKYPPADFQRRVVIHGPGLFAAVFYFDPYYFFPPSSVYEDFPHGIFVFAGSEPTPVAPHSSIRYPNGTIAYKLVFK